MVSDVRDARLEDAARMSAVQASSWRAAYRGIVPDDFLDRLDDDVWTARWRRSLADGAPAGEHLLVSTADDQVVAVAACGPARDEASPATGELYLVYTDPDHWGEGHGGALIREVERRLAADGHRAACLWVAARNERSVAVYEHLGWALDGTTRQDEVNGVAIDEARMVRDLA